MPSKKELMNISKMRLKEVKLLQTRKFNDGARYLAGYAVETALKARICKILKSDYPDTGEISRSFLTHKFEVLIRLGGLKAAFDSELAANLDFKTNWSLVSGWSESFRYSPIGSVSDQDVLDLLNALEDQSNGVLTWIKKRW